MTNNIISENNPLTILVYSPYSQAMPHVLHEITIAKSLQMRGANVIYICCDKFYSVCDANWERWGKKNEDSCRLCMSQAKSRLELYEIKHEWLSSYIDHHTVSSIYQWINNLPIDQLRMCSYKDYAVGGYGLASLCSHYRLSNLDMKEPHIIYTYKNYIAGSALAIDALTEALDVHKPDVILMFNGRFFSHNILLSLAKQRGITAYIHERSSIKDTILFKYNGNILESEQSKNHWKAWEDIPLSSGEVNCIDDYLAQRKLGNNTGCLSISHANHDEKFIYETLNISQNTKIITLFTSSTDEYIGYPGLKFIINQTDLIKRAISFFKDKIEYCLVIRVHPNATESDLTNTDMAALKDSLPPNVKILYPDDKISSYKLIEVSNANIVFMSSIGIEAAAMGKPVLMCSDISSFYGHRYSLNLPDADSCEEYIELLLSEDFSIERIRAAYRHAYFIFFRRCIPFPLVNSYETYKAKVCYPSNDLLIPGYDESLDRVCEAILNKRSADQFPDELLNYSRKDEDDFLDRKLGTTRRDTKGNTLIQKILFVCHNIPPYEFSGTPIITHTQAREMLSRGKEVAVLIPSQEVSGTFFEETAPDGLRIFKIPKIDRRWSFFEELQNPVTVEKHLDMVKEILRRFEPDVIHVNDYVDMPVLIFEAFAASKAIIVREIWNDEEICFRVSPIIEETHEVCSGPESFQECSACYSKSISVEMPDLQQKLESHWRYIEHIYASKINGAIFASPMFRSHFNQFISIPDEKIATIACGLQRPSSKIAFPLRPRESVTTFTFMGNFFEFRKGLDVLLHACLKLGNSPNLRVLIYGQGRADAIAAIENVSRYTQGTVSYQGRYSSNDLPQIIDSTDVGIVTSYFESYCLVLREFLAAGIPVITTDFSGSEIVKDGLNGFLLRRGDASTLANRINAIATNNNILHTLSEGAKTTPIPTAQDEANELLDFYAKLAQQQSNSTTDSIQNRFQSHIDNNLLKKLDSKEIWHCGFMGTRLNLNPSTFSLCHDSEVGDPISHKIEDLTPETYFASVNHILEELNNNSNFPCRSCSKCKIDLFKFKKINFITVCTSNYCNSSCIYCTSHIKKPHNCYDPIYYIVKFHNQGLLSSDCLFDWGGGEPTLNPYFETAVNWLNNHGYRQRINTNAILFSQMAYQALLDNKATIRISVDSGSRKIYRKVKGTDYFDDVWENISRYCKAGNKIYIKYNICNYNSDKGEIDCFLAKCKQNGVRNIIIDAEVSSYQPSKNAGPFYYREKEHDAAKYLESLAKAERMKVSISGYAYSARPEYDEYGKIKLPSCYYNNIDFSIISSNVYITTFACVDHLIDKLAGNPELPVIIWGDIDTAELVYYILKKHNIDTNYFINNENKLNSNDTFCHITPTSITHIADKYETAHIILVGSSWKNHLRQINAHKYNVNRFVYYLSNIKYFEYSRNNNSS